MPSTTLQDGASDEPQSIGELLRDEWAVLLGRWEWDWFATLTFRTDVHPEAADKRFRQWIANVERERRRAGLLDSGLRWVRALEFQKRGVIHFHVLLGEVGPVRFKQAHEHWHEGHAWIERARNGAAVRAYVSKYVAKGGELEIGGAGMPEHPIVKWPSRTYSRSKVRAALAPLSLEERETLLRWLDRDGRPSTRPHELLERAAAALQARGESRRAANAQQQQMALGAATPRPTASGRVYGPESDGGVPQTVRLGEHPQALDDVLTPAGAAH